MLKPHKHYVITDLHVVEGKLSNGIYPSTKSVFAGLESSIFINHHISHVKESKNLPIINNGFIMKQALLNNHNLNV